MHKVEAYQFELCYLKALLHYFDGSVSLHLYILLLLHHLSYDPQGGAVLGSLRLWRFTGVVGLIPRPCRCRNAKSGAKVPFNFLNQGATLVVLPQGCQCPVPAPRVESVADVQGDYGTVLFRARWKSESSYSVSLATALVSKTILVH